MEVPPELIQATTSLLAIQTSAIHAAAANASSDTARTTVQPRPPFSSRNRPRQHTQSATRNDAKPSRNTHTCNGCGGSHARKDCKFRDAECHSCKKKGHIAKVCKSKEQTTSQIVATEQPAEKVDVIQRLNSLKQNNAINTVGRQFVTVLIEGRSLQMELDSGASCGIISKAKLQEIKLHQTLNDTDLQFVSYTHHHLKCIGYIPVNVTLGSTMRKLNLYVVDGNNDILFGREWISQFVHEIDFEKLFTTAEKLNSLITPTVQPLTVDETKRLNTLLQRYDDIFSEQPGKLVGPPVLVHLKPDVTPIFARAREIPVALRGTYAKEIDSKLASGFYKRVEHSEWASTIHIVMKKNGKMRITGNYKPTLNPRMVIDEHPIPKAEHIFHRMKGSTLFCHIDITDAYTHLVIDEEFSHALTLNTPMYGLIRPTRAVYGAANIPAIWQRRMETVLQDIPNTLNFFDDILVFADNFTNLQQ
ncbi:PREDICTED: uncharacterized protein K02A2.6-like [Cyphomyrmex costatus]|uniref:uncharacterized protein K02A2.6-like n=1 Tax=Cyphomyrmex costatus TaxID=456900 RepID=UPI0008523A15|nr:PREDICTED: uncharacterized protein K02A2.6-like [Cyphomyrmex costatus]